MDVQATHTHTQTSTGRRAGRGDLSTVKDMSKLEEHRYYSQTTIVLSRIESREGVGERPGVSRSSR